MCTALESLLFLGIYDVNPTAKPGFEGGDFPKPVTLEEAEHLSPVSLSYTIFCVRNVFHNIQSALHPIIEDRNHHDTYLRVFHRLLSTQSRRGGRSRRYLQSHTRDCEKSHQIPYIPRTRWTNKRQVEVAQELRQLGVSKVVTRR